MKIGIIGGGAAGLVCAIKSKNNDNEVIILERNPECGKKILATGNGRCNYWNNNQDLLHYESSTPNQISGLINEKTEKYVQDFFDEIGIIPKIKNGYYYPNSNQSLTIRNVLIEEALDKKVKIKNNYLVKNIQLKHNKFLINNELLFDKIVLSTGSFAAPKTGSTGIGYDFLKQFNHHLRKPLPALVPLITKNYLFLKKWQGIRTDAKVTLIENGNILKEEVGEIQLTNYGISGICIFNLSNKVARGLAEKKEEIIKIDFLPTIDNQKLEKILNKNKSIKRILDCLLNSKLVEIILEEANLKQELWSSLEYNKKKKLIELLKSFKVEVVATKTFEEAQVTSGGVYLEEINLDTMESKIIPNLYIIGELLDLTGDCGGYNLGIAWRSGIVAGMTIGEAND